MTRGPVQLISRYFRRARMAAFATTYGITGAESVIDVGGYEANWQLLPVIPQVLLVNLEDETWRRDQFTKVKGDGCDLHYPDGSFDIAYSNSVIEHVGPWRKQLEFSREIRRVGLRYYVQTPYRHFPVEPHYLMPFIHYMPAGIQKRLIRWATPLGWATRPRQAWIDQFVDDTRLLTKCEFKRLFPDAVIIEERFWGLTKSLIAVKR
jgi:SAM-dependent methyltransferase